MGKKWWDKGVRFECQGSGKCCVSHGEFGFVFLSKEDRQRLADNFGMNLTNFTKKYCRKSDGRYHLFERKENTDCIFLKNKSCSVYEARPTQCRTWPFWPEVMNARAWKKDVAEFCPGVNKGKVWSAQEIKIQLDLQKQSESPSKQLV